MNLTKTWPQTLAYGETKLGIPYSETEDGGVGPNFFDCSGLMQNIIRWAGDSAFTRTTYSQWGDGRYLHMGPYGFGQAPKAQAGWIAYMHVSGEADPGHVGLCLGDGTYLNAPHTGAVVRIEQISNTPSEHVYGYLLPSYGSAPPPTPPPTPTNTQEMTQMGIAIDPQGNAVSTWVGKDGTNAAGHAFVVTQKAGTLGQPPSSANTSIIDLTSTWSFFQVEEG